MSGFLEYAKSIIQKVSFDRHLLNKEYRKNLRYLTIQERRELQGWVEKQPFATVIDPSYSAEYQKRHVLDRNE